MPDLLLKLVTCQSTIRCVPFELFAFLFCLCITSVIDSELHFRLLTLDFMCMQCQSQLTTLYAEGIKGCHMEFAAYNLLCVILHSNNNRDLVSAMSRSVTV